MDRDKIESIRRQLQVLAQQAPEIIKAYRRPSVVRGPAGSLFAEAVEAGALDGPDCGFLKGKLAAVPKSDSSKWPDAYFVAIEEPIAWLVGEKFEIKDIANPIITIDRAVRFLSKVSGAVEAKASEAVKVKGSGRVWSKVMSKTDMMVRLGGLSPRKLKAFAKDHPVKMIGKNRQTWQMDITDCDERTQKKMLPSK